MIFSCFLVAFALVFHVVDADDSLGPSLRVTYDPEPPGKSANPFAFNEMPLTKSDAETQGFVPLPSKKTDQFLGERYYKDGDMSVVMLYDKHGYVIGLQVAYPKSEVTYDGQKKFFSQKYFQENDVNGETYYFVTLYLVNPKFVGKGNRSGKFYETTLGGTFAALQAGPDPMKDLLVFPRTDRGIKLTRWVKSGCIPGMGRHYWYDRSKDMDCAELVPVTALYNDADDSFLGVALPVFGQFPANKRLEHPPREAFQPIFAEVPDCVYANAEEANGVSSIHVYLKKEPWNIKCPAA